MILTVLSTILFVVLSLMGFDNPWGIYNYFYLPWYLFSIWMLSLMWLFHITVSKVEKKLTNNLPIV